jgi:hypothetical protein
MTCAPGFRRIAQDRLQDLRSLQGARVGPRGAIGRDARVGYVVLPLRGVTYVSGAGHLICWRATTDDDEHYVYAIAL